MEAPVTIGRLEQYVITSVSDDGVVRYLKLSLEGSMPQFTRDIFAARRWHSAVGAAEYRRELPESAVGLRIHEIVAVKLTEVWI